MNNIPNDATGDAIRRWIAEGSDITQPMNIDFFVALPNEKFGELFVREPRLKTFTKLSVEADDETNEWTCYCSATIIPSYENIAALEQLISEIAVQYGAKYDGFGSFGNSIKLNWPF